MIHLSHGDGGEELILRKKKTSGSLFRYFSLE
jgi:hypothetical protein